MYVHTYIIIIIIVLSNLSVSDVSIYFVWLTALLVVRDELEHLWRAISCCRLNRSPQVSHLNGSFARSATVILLLTVPQFGIRLLCRFKSCGRLNCFPHRSQDICIHTSSSSSCVRIISSLPNLGFTSLCLAASTSGSAVHVPLLHHPHFCTFLIIEKLCG